MRNTLTAIPEAQEATRRLLEYCRTSDWSGHDPYDALNSELLDMLPLLDTRVPRLVMTQLLKRSPIDLRRLLRVPKTQNPKALGLFLSSFLKLQRVGLLDDSDLVVKIVERLTILRSGNNDHWCWGYSFPWQTRTQIVPRRTPNLVCTAFVASALLDAYEALGDQRCLEMALSAAEYILRNLYWSEGRDTAGFSYPLPTMRLHIHNANFLGAALLCRVSALTGKKGFLEPAFTVARFSAGRQRANGSWPYGEMPTQKWVDNFHTGYNLCALRSIGRHTCSSEFDSHIRRGFEFYRNHFFREDSAPKYFHDHTYPIDVHCVAQSMITLLEFKDLADGNVGLAHDVYRWAMSHMWDERGYFYYRVRPFYTIKTSYMRWSQAWMLLALARLLEECNSHTAAKQGVHAMTANSSVAGLPM
jgi:hypothetical protein